RGFDLLAVVDALADAHVEHDLVEPRHLHRVLVTELLGHAATYDVVEMFAQARRIGRRRGAAVGLRLLPAALFLRLGFGLGLGLALGFVLGLPLGLVLGLALLAFRGLGLSHRSRLLNAWRPAPSCRPAKS